MSEGHPLIHHLVHFVVIGSAAVTFVVYVAVDVRRHGWPSFMWRTGSGGAGPRP